MKVISIIIIVGIFMVLLLLAIFTQKWANKVVNEKRKKIISEKVIENNKIIFKYITGLKGISKDIHVSPQLTEEGILFSYSKLNEISTKQDIDDYLNGIKKNSILIKWENIIDINLETEKHIYEKVKLGNMLLFGSLAFAMDKDLKTTETEYIVLLVNSENNDEKYNIILEAGVKNQALYDLISSNIFKENHLEKLERSNNNDVYYHLNKISELKDKGILTQEEFDEKKKSLLKKIN